MKAISFFILRAICLSALVLAVSIPTVPAEAASYVVNTTDDTDDGSCDAAHCSLREAINAGNANPGPDEITFDIPGPGPHVISVCSPVLQLTDDSTTIDGTTEPGYSGQPVIMIGPPAPALLVLCPAPITGLWIESSDNLVRGISWVGFGTYSPSGPLPLGADPAAPAAIAITGGSGNRIEANYIGLNPSGAVAANSTGLRIESSGQSVIGNVISGNRVGIHVLASDQVIQGNRIGTDPGGTVAIGNGLGVFLDEGGDSTQVGGAAAGAGNLISGNVSVGLFIHHESKGNLIQGNRIGTNAAGEAAVPGGYYGIYMCGDNNQIGGAAPGQGNLVSGNGTGIWVSSSSTGSFIQGNQIGSNAGGDATVPNGRGIESESSGITIGGLATGEGNLVVGNTSMGIALDDLAEYNLVVGNTIHSNAQAGVWLNGGDVRRNTISQNSIFDNAGLGIELEPGTNEDIAAPTLSFVTLSSAHGTACPNCTVELFIADPDPSGAGEGRTHLVTVSAGADGSFSATFSGVSACDWITATNTDPAGNTSEFSPNRRTCITLPWPWPALGIAVLAAAGALLGAAGGRRQRMPRPLAVAVGGLAGGMMAMMLVGAIAGLRIAAFQVPASYPPFTRPTHTPTHGDVAESVEHTLEAYMTQVMAATLTAQPTYPPTPTRTPTLTRTPTVTSTPVPSPTPAEFTAEVIQDANCRSGPGTRGYRSITSFAAGDLVTLEGRNPDGTWSLVRRDYADGSIRCWVWNGALQGNTSDLPVLQPPPTMTLTPTPRVGCWVPGAAGNVCTVPCPAGARGGPCTP
jgi:CSLREA domain-containing protein